MFPIATIDNVENSFRDTEWKRCSQTTGSFETRLATMFVITTRVFAHINKKLSSEEPDGNWIGSLSQNGSHFSSVLMLLFFSIVV